MALSTLEREDLVRRVSARVKHSRVGASHVRDAVDRVVEALPPMPNARPATLVVVTRADMPDLASRLRRAVPAPAFAELVAEQSGRHTVVVASVHALHRDAVQQAAAALGATWTERDA
jgi:hypothetical protein